MAEFDQERPLATTTTTHSPTHSTPPPLSRSLHRETKGGEKRRHKHLCVIAYVSACAALRILAVLWEGVWRVRSPSLSLTHTRLFFLRFFVVIFSSRSSFRVLLRVDVWGRRRRGRSRRRSTLPSSGPPSFVGDVLLTLVSVSVVLSIFAASVSPARCRACVFAGRLTRPSPAHFPFVDFSCCSVYNFVSAPPSPPLALVLSACLCGE